MVEHFGHLDTRLDKIEQKVTPTEQTQWMVGPSWFHDEAFAATLKPGVNWLPAPTGEACYAKDAATNIVVGPVISVGGQPTKKEYEAAARRALAEAVAAHKKHQPLTAPPREESK